MNERAWISALLWTAAGFSFCIALIANLQPETFNQIWVCYTVFSLIGLIALATTGLLIASDISVLIAFGFLTLQAIMMVATTAAIFSGFGIIQPQDVEPTRLDSLYFSIVTWTTLGYGDFQPKPALRLLAAMQAVYGYLFLGLIVGSVSSLIGNR